VGKLTLGGKASRVEEGDSEQPAHPSARHDHGNDSSRPMVWLDGLDIPMVAMFNAGFAENGAEDEQAARIWGAALSGQ